MSGWGIAETAPVIEKIKAESADYLRGLNSCGEITWSVYDKAFDFYMELISRAYEQGKKDAQPEIIRCKDCKYRMPYDWMFSEVWQSQNMDDYSEEEIGCQYCDMSMKSDDFCSRAERKGEQP